MIIPGFLEELDRIYSGLVIAKLPQILPLLYTHALTMWPCSICHWKAEFLHHSGNSGWPYDLLWSVGHQQIWPRRLKSYALDFPSLAGFGTEIMKKPELGDCFTQTRANEPRQDQMNHSAEASQTANPQNSLWIIILVPELWGGLFNDKN